MNRSEVKASFIFEWTYELSFFINKTPHSIGFYTCCAIAKIFCFFKIFIRK